MMVAEIFGLICVLSVIHVHDFNNFAMKSLEDRLPSADELARLNQFVLLPTGVNENSFILNDSFWLKDVDFSCVSIWNSSFGNLRGGTAISRRHIVCSKHFPLPTGCGLAFLGRNRKTYLNRIDRIRFIENSDIQVASLEKELPQEIVPANILPMNYAKFIGNGSGFPVVTFNKKRKVTLSELMGMSTNPNSVAIYSHRSPKHCYSIYQTSIQPGDSGCPAFLLIGSDSILLYCITGGKAGSGSSLFLFKDNIQAAMDELCPGYKLQYYNFSTDNLPASVSLP